MSEHIWRIIGWICCLFYRYTANQIHGRWNALVTLYRRMVEYNANPRNERMTIAYQEAIKSVFKFAPERKIKLAKIREKNRHSAREYQSMYSAFCNTLLSSLVLLIFVHIVLPVICLMILENNTANFLYTKLWKIVWSLSDVNNCFCRKMDIACWATIS